MTPLIAVFVSQMAGTLAQALLDKHAPGLDEKLGELLRTGMRAHADIDRLDDAAREEFLKALEVVMASAQHRIRQRMPPEAGKPT